MALLGLDTLGAKVQYIPAPPMVSDIPNTIHDNSGVTVNAKVGGEPIRIVMLVGAGALGIYALKLAGFKFNVGVS